VWHGMALHSVIFWAPQPHLAPWQLFWSSSGFLSRRATGGSTVSVFFFENTSQNPSISHHKHSGRPLLYYYDWSAYSDCKYQFNWA